MKRKTHSKFAVLHVCLLVVLFRAAAWIKLHSPEWGYKLVAGFLLGSIGAIALGVGFSLMKQFRTGGWRAIEANAWWWPFTIVLYGVLLLMGLLVWVTGWTGNTGVFYGAGVVVAGSLFQAGAGPLLKDADTPR